MNKTIIYILIIIGVFPLILQSDSNEIEAFDKLVTNMKPIPQKMDINIEVIGLEIRKGSKVENQLTKVANAGGGQYHGVQDAVNLGKIFTQVVSANNKIPNSNNITGLGINKQEKLGMALVNEGKQLEKSGDILGAILKYKESFKYKYKIDQLIALRVISLEKKHKIK